MDEEKCFEMTPVEGGFRARMTRKLTLNPDEMQLRGEEIVDEIKKTFLDERNVKLCYRVEYRRGKETDKWMYHSEYKLREDGYLEAVRVFDELKALQDMLEVRILICLVQTQVCKEWKAEDENG